MTRTMAFSPWYGELDPETCQKTPSCMVCRATGGPGSDPLCDGHQMAINPSSDGQQAAIGQLLWPEISVKLATCWPGLLLKLLMSDDLCQKFFHLVESP